MSTPAPCLHEVQHQHGTLACAQKDKCPCLPCARAVSEYRRTRRLRIGYGQWEAYVDPEPARQRVQFLRSEGMTVKEISDATSLVSATKVSEGTIKALVNGRSSQGSVRPLAKIRPETESAILAISAPKRSIMPSYSKALRLLRSAGASNIRVAEISKFAMNLVRRSVSTGGDVSALHGRLSAELSTLIAPMKKDDIDRLSVISQQVLGSKMSTEERRIMTRLLVGAGMEPDSVAQVFGVSRRTVTRDLADPKSPA